MLEANFPKVASENNSCLEKIEAIDARKSRLRREILLLRRIAKQVGVDMPNEDGSEPGSGQFHNKEYRKMNQENSPEANDFTNGANPLEDSLTSVVFSRESKSVDESSLPRFITVKTRISGQDETKVLQKPRHKGEVCKVKKYKKKRISTQNSFREYKSSNSSRKSKRRRYLKSRMSLALSRNKCTGTKLAIAKEKEEIVTYSFPKMTSSLDLISKDSSQLSALKAELDTVKRSLKKEVLKNEKLTESNKALKSLLDGKKRIQAENSQDIQPPYQIHNDEQVELAATLQPKNGNLKKYAQRVKYQIKQSHFQTKLLEKEYKVLCAAIDKSNNGDQNKNKRIYDYVMKALKKEILYKESMMEDVEKRLQPNMNDQKKKEKKLDGLNEAKTSLHKSREETHGEMRKKQHSKHDKGLWIEAEWNNIPSQLHVAAAFTCNNWKVINLENIVNNALNSHFGSSSSRIQYINKETLQIHRADFFSDINRDYWYVSLSLGKNKNWDPSSEDEQFAIDGFGIRTQRGRIVYESPQLATDVLFFFVLLDIDPCGKWIELIMKEEEGVCLLRKDTAKRDTKWMALIRMKEQIYMVNIKENTTSRKPVLICDRRLTKTSRT